MRRLVTVFFGLLLAAVPAAAQDEKPVEVNFGFGWTFPTTDFKNSFDAGWNGTIGATFNVNPKFGIQGEYIYSRMNGPDRTVNIASTPGGPTTPNLIESNHQMHVGNVNLVYKAASQEKPFGGYLLGGMGIYHRIVQLTTPAVGFVTVCDPFWYVCYPDAVSVDQVIGDRSSNDFGINFGGGVTFGRSAKFYIESRYHYAFGKTFQPAASVNPGGVCAGGCKTSAGYFPLTFGVRF